jgi:hypothetical protein
MTDDGRLMIEDFLVPMMAYPVLCYTKGCGRRAVYKIAARWSDGITAELKTYALACEECVGEWYRLSLRKQAACRRAPSEIHEPPGIFAMERGRRDAQIQRRTDLEEQFKE